MTDRAPHWWQDPALEGMRWILTWGISLVIFIGVCLAGFIYPTPVLRGFFALTAGTAALLAVPAFAQCLRESTAASRSGPPAAAPGPGHAKDRPASPEA